MTREFRQRGTVIIVAMLIAALAAASAAFALQRQDVSVRTLEAARDREQARWIVRGGAQWARTILAEDARSSVVDHARELWASGLPPTEVEQGTLAGRITDQQGLFNLANLVRDGAPSEPDVAALRRLLQTIGLRAELAESIAASQPMSELGELHRVRGCDDAVVARLRQFVTVLPRRAPVNVNTARPEVLSAVVDGLTLAEAVVLANAVLATPVRGHGDLSTRLPRAELSVASDQVSFQSAFFLVEGRATVGRAEARLQALLSRDGSRLPAIVWQRLS